MNLSLIKSHTIKQFADAEILNPTKAKTWFYFNEYGLCESTEIDKYTLATKLQIPLRDMRVLDPLFPTPYPSAIFIRDYSIILNLEHIKLIACQDQVWLLDSNKTGSFSSDSLDSLDRLVRALSVTLRVKENANNVSCNSSFHEMQETLYRKWSKKISAEQKLTQEETMGQLLSVDLKLPFELRAVEAALYEFTRYLDENVAELEDAAIVALDSLSKQVSRATLETIRGIKSTMNGLYARVSKTREELERLLDDDDDMANMHLGEVGGSFNIDSPHLQTPMTIPESPMDSIYSPRYVPRRRGAHKKKREKYSKMASLASAKSQGAPFYEVWQQKEIDEVEAVEAFLEVYFMKSDFLMKRLSVLKEKIDDTEDLINIDLDFRRNELFKVDILLTTGTLSMGLVSAIAGIFGMNLQSGGEEDETDKSYMYFVLVALIASGGCILLFVGLALYLKSRKLMFVSESNIVSSDRKK